MKKSTLLNSMILAALAVPGLAMAEDSPFSGNVKLTTDYLFRGISQTGGGPALQGGFDYAHPSGFYIGAWGSNISWISDLGGVSNISLELDTYLGYSGAFAEHFSYDVGYLRYNYPGTYSSPIPTGAAKADTNEIYGSVGWKWVTLKYSYSLGDTFAVADAKGSSYLELNASYTLEDQGVTLGAHFGTQTYKADNSLTALGYDKDAATYSDYNLSASKDFSGYEVGLTYSSTNVKKGGPGQDYYTLTKADGSTYDLGKGTLVLSLSHSM